MSSPQDRLSQLMAHQRRNIKPSGNYDTMSFDDLKRIDRYIHDDIFNLQHCCLYKGERHLNYTTISFRGKKVSLLRLLYHNYITSFPTSSPQI